MPPEDPPSKPVPNAAGYMSSAAKLNLADIALALRDEQLEAKVVHYRAELDTNPELDAITAQVIDELQGLQAAVRMMAPARDSAPAIDRAAVEQDLIQTLYEMLSRVFRNDRLAPLIERKLGEVAKRFARVFFESELADKIRGSQGEQKTMRFFEQALFHAFKRVEDQVLDALHDQSYSEDAVRQKAQTKYFEILKELRNDFLARTTPELNTLISYLNAVLSQFFTTELPPAIDVLASDVVRDANLAAAHQFGGYKISARAFSMFRQAFERRFMQRLVPFVADEMLQRVRGASEQFRHETIRFVADPQIFSEVCEVVCDAVYDMLYNDGFLDLPSDWRARLYAGG